jgi:hypothetical protein
MGKFFYLLFGFCLFVIGNSYAQKITENDKSGSVQTALNISNEVLELKETEFDFGSIPQGKPVTHIFEVVNHGKDSLKILNVQASCGCTTPQWDAGKVFAAGEKTNISVGFNAASKGRFQKDITITYNNNQTKKITIKGDVWETPATSAPENTEIGTLKNL